MDQPEPGSIVGHYKIVSPLGAGGMGVVYEAEDLKLGRHVALKMLSGSADPGALERFWREARAASALNHPGICTLYEINESQSPPFLVMELLEGQSLDRLYGGHSVPLARLIELGVQIADALDAAHRKGILHRDIKPANIFVTHSGQTKILDFGLARFEDPGSGDTSAGLSDRQLVTTPGSTLGTIAYMSPEQARGEALDARSDVFSLGVVLYEMGTGRHPFEGTTTAIVFDKLLNYMPPAAIAVNHELPPEFESIITKALEKDRDLRYQSAADLRADLRRLQRVSSAARVVASGINLAAAPAYPGMTRSGRSATAVESAPVQTTHLIEDPPPLSVQFASSLDVSAAIRASGAPPPEPPPSRVSRPLPRFNRTHFRYLLLGLTAVVIVFSVWARFFHHPHGRAALTPPAAAAPPAPTTTGATNQTQAATSPKNAANVSPAAAPPEKTSPAKPAPGEEPASRKSREATAATKPPHPVQRAAVEPPPTIQIMQPPTAPATSANPSSSSAAASTGSNAAPSRPAASAATPAPAAPHPAGVTYSARHMHSFPFINGRSCDGNLELTPSALIFTSDVHPVTLTRAAVSGIDGNTVIGAGGKKWRFEIYGMSNTEVHNLLIKWWNSGH